MVGESWLETGLKESWLRLEGEGGRMAGWLGDEVWNFPERCSKMSHGIFQEVGGFFAQDFGDGVAEGLVWHYR